MRRAHGQMSESLLLGAMLAMAGGFFDAYTYLCRGKVFANAQTGNIVLFGANIAEGNWLRAAEYFLPILAFALGVVAAEIVKRRYKKRQSDINIHWRQIVVLVEIVLLIAAAFLPQSMNTTVNIMISFICAMQVESFRKVRGSAFATTMCKATCVRAPSSLDPSTDRRPECDPQTQLLLNHPVFYPRRCDWRTDDRENWRKSAAADLHPAESGLCSHVCRGRTYARGGVRSLERNGKPCRSN